jgi:MFS family permease
MPIPYLLIHAGNWNWVIFANLLLGIGQGLTWSSTIVMKIDLVGDKQRGLAMGLNEFAGYFAVGIVAFLTGYLANHYGVTPYPFYVGIVLSTLGLMFTVLWIKDTQKYSEVEGLKNVTPQLNNVFIDTTLKDKTLSAVTQAGLVNNLNDGMIWGLLPMLLLSMHYNQQYIGTITAVYPTVWGISQVFTGKLSDMYAKKSLLFWGMFLQALAILYLPFGASFIQFVLIAVLLGLGTALVYPTFLSTIARATHPSQRAESIGTFRLWRDLGYAFGAIISGITADLFGIKYAILIVGFITLLSALVIKYRMPNE